MTNTNISFPGLGIDEFSIDPVAIPIGEMGVRWYALFIVTGMLLALLYCTMRAKSEGIKIDTMIDFAIFAIPVGIIGARLYYVFFDWMSNPDNYKTFMDVIEIWKGGLAIYGGIIFGAITIFIVAKVKKMSSTSLFKVTDSVAPGVMIAQAIGRWGNFCNGEAFGTPTNLPWGMTINGSVPVHPTFLYESLWNVLGFILINIFYKKKRFDGQITLMYITWYGFGRMLIELLRTDSLTTGGELRISSLIGLLCFLVGGTLLLFFFIKNKGKCAYTPASANGAPINDGVKDEATESEADSSAESADILDGNGEAPPEDSEDTEDTENTENSENSENINKETEEKDDGKLD